MQAPQAMSHYPVDLDVAPPEKFERIQLLVRLLLSFALGYVGFSFGWLFGLLYLALPAFAAVVVTRKGGERFIDENGPPVARVLRWIIRLYAYMLLVTDRFPTDEAEQPLRVTIQPIGRPTVGSALGRVLTSIPASLVLAVLAFISGILVVIAALFVLIGETYPRAIYGYQRGVLRWQARLLVYHASLVDLYPPFSLESGHEHAGGGAHA